MAEQETPSCRNFPIKLPFINHHSRVLSNRCSCSRQITGSGECHDHVTARPRQEFSADATRFSIVTNFALSMTMMLFDDDDDNDEHERRINASLSFYLHTIYFACKLKVDAHN